MNKSTWGLLALALSLRLVLIFPGPLESKVGFFANPADLRNYYWPAQAALRGENPYVLWATGQSGEFRADMAPLELLVYIATVAVWNDPRAIQVLFALCDVLNVVLLGRVLSQSILRLPFQIFYAMGPLTLYNLVLVPQDKTILLALTFLIFYFLRLPQGTVLRFSSWRIKPATLIIALAAILAAFKWLSAFYLLPLLLFVSRDWRDWIRYGLLFGFIVALSHALWFPDWLYVYTFRASRMAEPGHIAFAALLESVGLYNPTLLTAALVILLGIIYWLFWRKRIDIFETIALAVMTGIFWTPDMDPVHLSIIVLHLMLVVNWSGPARITIVWMLSALSAVVYAISTRPALVCCGLPDWRWLTGLYGSPQMILFSYILLTVTLGFYLYDKWRGYAVGQQLLGEANK